MDHHHERQYFMAPHLAGGHWSLSVIFHNPQNHKFYGYIIDSKKKGKTPKSYIITKLFEKATGESIVWQMVNGEWECGYYVMKAMHDIVISCQEKIIFEGQKCVIFHNPQNHKFYGYIIDSKKKGKTPKSCIITELFEKATGESIVWQMVNLLIQCFFCPQQKGEWECGYYVMKAMHDILISCQEKIVSIFYIHVIYLYICVCIYTIYIIDIRRAEMVNCHFFNIYKPLKLIVQVFKT
ncbi:putative Ulp1 protease family catalytic domain, papain-like cysteine peptidase superfamily [Helianthus anomalus]